jgi:hypothetical protein
LGKIFADEIFQLVPMMDGILIEQIRYYRTVQCLVGVRGSGLVNCMWMMQNTAMVEIQAGECDLNFARLGVMCGLRVFETSGRSIDPNSRNGFTFPWATLCYAVRHALEAMGWKDPGMKV